MDIRQLWFSPVFFGSKCVKIRELHCSLPRWHSHSTQPGLCPDMLGRTEHTGVVREQGPTLWGWSPEVTFCVTCTQMTPGKEPARSMQDQSPGANWEAGWRGQLGSLLWHTGPNTPLSYSFPWLWSMEPNSHKHPAHHEDKGILMIKVARK